MMQKMGLLILIAFGLLSSCSSEGNKEEAPKEETSALWSFEIDLKALSPEEYPDDPDEGYYAKDKDLIAHDKLLLDANPNGTFRITVLPANENSDTVVMPNFNINTYMLDVPSRIGEDAFLTKITIVNQEWNRQQIKYPKDLEEFEVRGNGLEKDIVRIDLARNCLNTKLWEIAFFVEEDGKEKPLFHSWFDFPLDLYTQLFEAQTDLKFADYEEHLIDWKDPEAEFINFDLIREKGEELSIKYEVYNDQYYPLTGARVKKEKNIVVPKVHETINDFLTDSTLYSTFTPPGFYNTKTPRVTELGRLAQVKNISLSKIAIPSIDTNAQLHEVIITFSDIEENRTTIWNLGGLDLDKLPVLSLQDHNKGYKMPMGIANHPFYENYRKAVDNTIQDNPYYSLLSDEEGNFLDSHKIGVDGPILFWDAEDDGLLRIMFLSFERHSFVGHYGIRIVE